MQNDGSPATLMLGGNNPVQWHHAHAEKFRERFGGEFIARMRSPDISLDDRHRNGRCENCAD
jgi:hypothetical protein